MLLQTRQMTSPSPQTAETPAPQSAQVAEITVVDLESAPPESPAHDVQSVATAASVVEPGSPPSPSQPAAQPVLPSPQPAAQPVSDTPCTRAVQHLKRFANGVLQTVFLSMIYIPFTVTLLWQSFVTKHGVDPATWQTSLTKWSWRVGWVFFLYLLAWPAICVRALLNSSGLDLNTNRSQAFAGGFYFFIATFVLLHCLTIWYTTLRRTLCKVHGTVSVLRLSVSNILPVLGLLFEFLQLVAPFLDPGFIGISSPDPALKVLHNLTSIALFRGNSGNFNSFQFTFWLCFAIVTLYALSLGKMYSAFSCVLASPPGQPPVYVLVQDNAVVCWQGGYHNTLLFAAFYGLVMYSSSAMFVACYRGDAAGDKNGDAKFIPRFLVIERTLRGVFAIVVTLVTNNNGAKSLALIIVIALLIITWMMHPCSVPVLNRIKRSLYLTALWACICSFLPLGVDVSRSSSFPYAYIAFVGWAVVWLQFAVLEYRHRCGRVEDPDDLPLPPDAMSPRTVASTGPDMVSTNAITTDVIQDTARAASATAHSAASNGNTANGVSSVMQVQVQPKHDPIDVP